jgi:endonuclease III
MKRLTIMKNATKHADTLRSLFRSLLRDGKPPPFERQDPLKALVRGAMSYDVSDTRAEEAMKHIEREFVHLNELRVATELEVQELLGVRYPAIEERVEMITRCLNAIFEKEHTLSLDRLKTISKRDARQFLKDLPGINPFVEGYVMLFAFEGASIPLDNEITAYLRDEDVFDEKISLDEGQRFLEHNIKAEECYEFYACIRRELRAEKGRKKAKV